MNTLTGWRLSPIGSAFGSSTWTVAALEREPALMNKLTRPFRDRGDEKAAALLKQIDARNAYLRRLIQHWSNVATWPHSLRR